MAVDTNPIDTTSKPKPEIVPLVLENNNENINIKITSNRTYLEFSKKILDHDVGLKLLAEHGYFKPKKQNIFGVSENKPQSVAELTNAPEEKKRIKFVTTSDTGKKDDKQAVTGNKPKVQDSDKFDWNTVLNDKNRIPKLNMKYKDYFFHVPRCNVCDMVGISLDELKRISSNRQAQLDIVTLDYLLLSCSVCKTNIHRNCLKDLQSAPFINIKEKNIKDWTCERCLEAPTETCFICHSDSKLNRRPYFIKVDHKWSHYLCYIWANLVVEGDSVELKMEKLGSLNMNYCDYCMSDSSQ
jgi:hypothetical protein